MRKRHQRIVEGHHLFSRLELCGHGFIQVLVMVSGVTAGVAAAAMLYGWFGQYNFSPLFIVPIGVITAALIPGAHLWDVGVKIATVERMGRVAINSATWLALCVPLCLFVFWGGFPLLNFVVAVAAIFAASFMVDMLLWYGCIWFGGDILVISTDRCFHCGYDLHGNVSGVCPECGADVGVAVTLQARDE